MKLRALWHGGMAALRAQTDARFRRPLGVYVHLTERCNANCVYCDYDRMAATTCRQLPADFVIDCLQQFAALGTVKLNLTGGEPLLVPELERIIDAARRLRMFIAVSTNGLLLAEQAERVRGVDVVMLSHDGREAVHDSLRGAGTFRRVLAAKEALAHRGIKFWTTTVLNRRTGTEIEYLIDQARQYRTVANFTLLQHLPEENDNFLLPCAARISDLIPDTEETHRMLDQLIGLKRSGAPIGSTLAYLEFLRRWPDYRELYAASGRGIQCVAGKLYCHLYADGALYACGQCHGIIPGEPVRGAGGVAAAFSRLRRLPCQSCRVACDMENALIYGLQPRVLLNWLREIGR
ncbi:MAG TPA: radical SAM protein [bacterium]|nr:radical SAM protein [bacterium]